MKFYKCDFCGRECNESDVELKFIIPKTFQGDDKKMRISYDEYIDCCFDCAMKFDEFIKTLKENK